VRTSDPDSPGVPAIAVAPIAARSGARSLASAPFRRSTKTSSVRAGALSFQSLDASS